MELIHSGKVRDVYADGDDLLLVATDRVSIYDVILPTPVPGKGRVLTQLSLWWFDRLGDIIGNHVISATDVPEEWAGRAIRCQRLEMVPVECIARGYLAGLGLTAYNETGAVSGVKLPARVYSSTAEEVLGETTKKPLPEIDRSVGEEVVMGRPWLVTSWPITAVTPAEAPPLRPVEFRKVEKLVVASL